MTAMNGSDWCKKHLEARWTLQPPPLCILAPIHPLLCFLPRPALVQLPTQRPPALVPLQRVWDGRPVRRVLRSRRMSGQSPPRTHAGPRQNQPRSAGGGRRVDACVYALLSPRVSRRRPGVTVATARSYASPPPRPRFSVSPRPAPGHPRPHAHLLRARPRAAYRCRLGLQGLRAPAHRPQGSRCACGMRHGRMPGSARDRLLIIFCFSWANIQQAFLHGTAVVIPRSPTPAHRLSCPFSRAVPCVAASLRLPTARPPSTRPSCPRPCHSTRSA